MNQDWRVSVAHVAFDAIVACAILVLVALKVLPTEIGIALVGPMLGARAAMVQQQRTAAASGVPAVQSSAALALLVGVGLVLRAWARGRGAAVAFVGLVLGATLAGPIACSQATRREALTVAGTECVLIQDPIGRAVCVGVDEIGILVNEIARRGATAGETSVASRGTTATTSAASAAPSSAASAAGSR